MSHKIIFPEGIELIEYLNRGYAICNECGALMERREDPRGGCDIYTCPSCGWEIDEMEYEYERDEDVDERGDDIPPAGCQDCFPTGTPAFPAPSRSAWPRCAGSPLHPWQ